MTTSTQATSLTTYTTAHVPGLTDLVRDPRTQPSDSAASASSTHPPATPTLPHHCPGSPRAWYAQKSPPSSAPSNPPPYHSTLQRTTNVQQTQAPTSTTTHMHAGPTLTTTTFGADTSPHYTTSSQPLATLTQSWSDRLKDMPQKITSRRDFPPQQTSATTTTLTY